MTEQQEKISAQASKWAERTRQGKHTIPQWTRIQSMIEEPGKEIVKETISEYENNCERYPVRRLPRN